MTSKRIRDLDEKYGDGNGIAGVWGNYKDERTPYWDLDRQFHPLTWGFGVEVNRQVGGSWDPHMLWFSVTVGPWTWVLRREWPNDREEFVAWATAREDARNDDDR